jgi:diguanylate cyclase
MVNSADELGDLARAFNWMAEQRQHAQALTEHLAYHDPLTGLPNRRLWLDRLQLALAQAHRKGEPLCVVSVDLDRFKVVNDTYGHSTGDYLLKVVADRLATATRETDTVARVGGDEFLLLLPDTDRAVAELIVARVDDILQAPVHTNGVDLLSAASLGISVVPHDGEDTDSLMNNADAAMYAEKRRTATPPAAGSQAQNPLP